MADAFVLVVNPRAGAGRAGKKLGALQAALTRLGADIDTRQTEGPGHATALVREALKAGAPGVAVVGGDGTLSEAANGFFDEQGEPIASPDRWIGPLPCGTGGDFRRTLGIGDDPEEIARRMVLAEPRRIDAGWIRFVDHLGQPAARAFINIASFGLSGLVDQVVNKSSKALGGFATFLAGTLRAHLRFRPPSVKVQVDGGSWREMKIVSFAVANGRYQGGGMMIAPEAELDDGLFDLVSIERASRLGQLALTPHLYDGTLTMRSGIHFERGRRLVAEPLGADPVLLDIDGEAPGRLPATFEIRPGALSVR